jgi:hypothetical protein
MANKKSAFG